MTAVIEQKLRAYERKYAIRDDVTLIVALRELLAAEEEREDCDWDAVAEMTDAILTLEGEDVGSFEASAEDAASFRAGDKWRMKCPGCGERTVCRIKEDDAKG